MKNMQLFIHRHYATIKLLMLFTIILMLAFLIQYAMGLRREGADNQRDLILSITRSIQEETRDQTKQQARADKKEKDAQNKQLQALCYIVLLTAGEQTLRQLDADIQDKCKSLAKEDSEAAPRKAPETVAPSSQPAIREPDTSKTSPTQTTGGGGGGSSNPQPTTPTQPTPRRGVLSPVTNIVNGVTNGLLGVPLL